MRPLPLFTCAFLALTLLAATARGQQTTAAPASTPAPAPAPAPASGSASALRFFVVYTQPGPGLHLYDTKQFPKLGYIAEKPDLIWTELKSAQQSKETIQDAKLGPDGHLVPTGTHTEPVIDLVLTQDETAQFFKLTTQYKGKRTLLMLGDLPLTAPMIDGPINTPSIRISGKVAHPEKFAAELQTLVKKP